MHYTDAGEYVYWRADLICHMRGVRRVTRGMQRLIMGELLTTNGIPWTTILQKAQWTSDVDGWVRHSELPPTTEEKSPVVAECCICMGDMYSDPVPLSQIRSHHADTTCVAAPCGQEDHRMCLGCVKRHATNWHNHSIGPLNASAVLCPHEGCHGAYEVPHFRSILPASQFERLQERQQRFKKSGTAWCPSVKPRSSHLTKRNYRTRSRGRFQSLFGVQSRVVLPLPSSCLADSVHGAHRHGHPRVPVCDSRGGAADARTY